MRNKKYNPFNKTTRISPFLRFGTHYLALSNKKNIFASEIALIVEISTKKGEYVMFGSFKSLKKQKVKSSKVLSKRSYKGNHGETLNITTIKLQGKSKPSK
ncbi:hypothetical protein C6360_28680 [Bacillus wiedmannii]|nr:hypothetical protein C6360_28680 [Bacillus wiedmannii]